MRPRVSVAWMNTTTTSGVHTSEPRSDPAAARRYPPPSRCRPPYPNRQARLYWQSGQLSDVGDAAELTRQCQKLINARDASSIDRFTRHRRRVNQMCTVKTERLRVFRHITEPLPAIGT